MKLQRRFAPIGGRNETESVAGYTGICICGYDKSYNSIDRDKMSLDASHIRW